MTIALLQDAVLGKPTGEAIVLLATIVTAGAPSIPLLYGTARSALP